MAFLAALQRNIRQPSLKPWPQSSLQQKPDCPLSEAQEHKALSIIIQTLGLGLPMLQARVTTGVHEPIPSSLQWPKKAQPHQDFMPLEMCEGNWSKPSIVQSLIDKEVASGWVQHIPGGRSAAQARWPSATAVGKLNLVEAPGKDPRLILDSTVCQVNPNCSLPAAHSVGCLLLLPPALGPSQHVGGSQPGLQSSPQAFQGQGTGPGHAPV